MGILCALGDNLTYINAKTTHGELESALFNSTVTTHNSYPTSPTQSSESYSKASALSAVHVLRRPSFLK